MSLFDFDDEDNINYDSHPKDWIYDEETQGYIPGPVKDDYPLVDYRRLKDYE